MLPALIGGIASIAGGIMQNSANQASANKQMAFQKETLQHQYQWATEDMKKAGINPMLAYQQGGAGSAAGAAAQHTNIGEAAVKGAESATNSANASRMISEQIKNMSADTDLKKANEKAAGAAILSSVAQAQLANANSATINALRPHQEATALFDSNTAMSRMNISANDAYASRVMADYLKHPAGRTARMLALGGKDAAEATSAFKLFGK